MAYCPIGLLNSKQSSNNVLKEEKCKLGTYLFSHLARPE